MKADAHATNHAHHAAEHLTPLITREPLMRIETQPDTRPLANETEVLKALHRLQSVISKRKPPTKPDPCRIAVETTNGELRLTIHVESQADANGVAYALNRHLDEGTQNEPPRNIEPQISPYGPGWIPTEAAAEHFTAFEREGFVFVFRERAELRHTEAGT